MVWRMSQTRTFGSLLRLIRRNIWRKQECSTQCSSSIPYSTESITRQQAIWLGTTSKCCTVSWRSSSTATTPCTNKGLTSIRPTPFRFGQVGRPIWKRRRSETIIWWRSSECSTCSEQSRAVGFTHKNQFKECIQQLDVHRDVDDDCQLWRAGKQKAGEKRTGPGRDSMHWTKTANKPAFQQKPKAARNKNMLNFTRAGTEATEQALQLRMEEARLLMYSDQFRPSKSSS